LESNEYKLGDFKFTFYKISEFDFPIFYVDIGSYKNMMLSDILGYGNPKEIYQRISQNIWHNQYGDVLEITFEDSSFSFIKFDLPKSGWDGEYEEDLSLLDILVRYTDPYTNNIATLTNIKEIEYFNYWYNYKISKI